MSFFVHPNRCEEMLVKRSQLTTLITLTLLTTAVHQAKATIVTYDDRAQWEAAIGGAPDFNEGFDSFAGPDNVSYNDSPLQTDYFEIESFSDSTNNAIDQNSTWEGIDPPSLHGFGDFFGNGIVLSFDQELSAWASNFRTSGGTEVVLLSEGNELAVFEPWTGFQGVSFFFGFTLTNGETIDAIELRRNNAGSSFLLDDVSGTFEAPHVSPVPEPSMMALFGLGAAGMGIAARCRRK